MKSLTGILIHLATAAIPVKIWRKRARRRLINIAEMSDLRRKMPGIRANYERIVARCAEKIAAGQPIDAVFLVLDGSMFSSEPIYRLMKADPAFRTSLFVIPDPSRGEEFMRKRQAKALATLQRNYPEARAAYDIDTGRAEPLEGRADIVFTSNPYHDQTLPQYTITGLGAHSLPVLVPYFYAGLHSTETSRLVFRPEYSMPWKLVLPNKEVCDIWTAANPLLKFAAVIGGYPKMDRMASTRPSASAGKTVIISPHHSIAQESDGATQSNFLRLADFFLSLPKRYPDLYFVFRPHPLLFQRFMSKETAGWDAKRARDYLAAWDSMPNACYQDGGDYFETFVSSAAMIHDCGSFLAEYFYTGHPQCYVLRSRDKIGTEFTPFGRRLVDSIATAVEESEILAFIDDVVVRGNDPQRAARKSFADEVVCSFHPQSADTVCGLVKRALGFPSSQASG